VIISLIGKTIFSASTKALQLSFSICVTSMLVATRPLPASHLPSPIANFVAPYFMNLHDVIVG